MFSLYQTRFFAIAAVFVLSTSWTVGVSAVETQSMSVVELISSDELQSFQLDDGSIISVNYDLGKISIELGQNGPKMKEKFKEDDFGGIYWDWGQVTPQQDGTWIFIGPTAFSFTELKHCLSREEYIRLIEDNGFKVEKFLHPIQPYMQSPHSCHGRIEKTLFVVAKKIKDTDPVEQIEYLPEWLTNADQQIPKFREIASLVQKHSIPQFVLSRVDGENSISDIAKELAGSYGLSEEEAVNSLQNFFVAIFEQELIFRK